MAPFCLFSHCNRFGFGGFPSFNLGFNLGFGFTNMLLGGRSFFNFPPAFGMFSSGFMSSPPPLILPSNISSIFEVPKFENNHIDYSAPWMQPSTFKPMMDTLSFGGSALTFNNPPIVQQSKTKTTEKTEYSSMTREEALAAAAADENLEELITSKTSKGRSVIVDSASFVNDIPYAKDGTMEILLEVADSIGQDIKITSALGTSSSPHVKTTSGASHYDAKNPKLDFGGWMSAREANALRSSLLKTGKFESVVAECDGDTWHLDVKIKDSAYEELA